MSKTNAIIAVGVLVIVGLLSFLTVYTIIRKPAVTATAPAQAKTTTTNTTSGTRADKPEVNQAAAAAEEDNRSLPSRIFGLNDASNQGATETESILRIILRLVLAVVLTALLAFRPRKNIPFLQRNLYVAQTQILLSVVAAALMMIVGDNTARAFAIFAAVSLVRFRTNIRDPKEITVLLISLAIGLATGVGRWDLGVVLCLFVLPLLWLLEYNEPEQVFRAMRLTIKTRNTDRTQDLLKQIFTQHKLEAEVRELDPPDEANPIGCIEYLLNLKLNMSTDQLSEQVLSTDPSIEGISWEQNKSATYVYQ